MVRAYFQRIKLLQKLDDFDAVFVYREAALIGPAFLEKMVARRGKPIIYQLDDPLYVPYKSPSNSYFSYLKFFGKVAEICRLSKVVIVNSSQIREYVSQYTRSVWQIPTIVDTEKYVFQPKPPHVGAEVCLGWSGSSTTRNNLKVIATPLLELARQVPHRLHLIGSKEFDLPGVNYTAQEWSADTEVEDLRQIDVGVVPLPVNEWNKRKFFMKTAQFMALGIPPVATPLGSNPQVIEHGVTGFLANSDEEWIEYLKLLISDPERRQEMSYRAAAVARNNYSLAANAEKILDAFRSALN